MHPDTIFGPNFTKPTTNYLTAAQAREQATTLVNNRNRSDFEAIMKLIHKACEEGSLSITVQSLNLWVEKELQKMGYKTKHYSDQRDNDSYYTISWVD